MNVKNSLVEFFVFGNILNKKMPGKSGIFVFEIVF